MYKSRPYRKYTPVTTSRPKRQKEFKAKGVSDEIAKLGITKEYGSLNLLKCVYWCTIIIGAVLTVLGITDTGLNFEILGFKYTGSLVGVPIIVFGIYRLKHLPNPSVDIDNSK